MRARWIIIYKLFSIWQCKTRSINLKVIDFVRINRNIFSSVIYLTLEKVKLSINFVTFISLYKHKLLYKLDLLKYIYIYRYFESCPCYISNHSCVVNSTFRSLKRSVFYNFFSNFHSITITSSRRRIYLQCVSLSISHYLWNAAELLYRRLARFRGSVSTTRRHEAARESNTSNFNDGNGSVDGWWCGSPGCLGSKVRDYNIPGMPFRVHQFGTPVPSLRSSQPREDLLFASLCPSPPRLVPRRAFEDQACSGSEKQGDPFQEGSAIRWNR